MPQIDFGSLPLFDPNLVDRLRVTLGEDQLSELMAFLPEEGRRVLNELSHARQTGDLSPVLIAAHGLRGVAGNFGVVRLEAISRAMNDKTASIDELEELAVHLRRCIEELDRDPV